MNKIIEYRNKLGSSMQIRKLDFLISKKTISRSQYEIKL